MAIAYVSGAPIVWALGYATTIATGALAVTTGNMIVVGVWNNGGVAVSGIADTAGNTYTKCGDTYGTMEIWVAKNITGHASNVVTATFPSITNYRAVGYVQYSGADTTAPYNAQAAGNTSASGKTHTTNNATTTTDGEVLVAGYDCVSTPDGLAASSPYTVRLRYDSGGSNGYYAIADQICGAAGTYNVSCTSTSNVQYYMFAKSFKATAVAADVFIFID